MLATMSVCVLLAWTEQVHLEGDTSGLSVVARSIQKLQAVRLRRTLGSYRFFGTFFLCFDFLSRVPWPQVQYNAVNVRFRSSCLR